MNSCWRRVTASQFRGHRLDLADRCFTVNGFAKGWAMTGWRLGYLAGHQDVIKAAAALQSQSTSNVCSFAQRGALAAIQGPRDCVDAMAESHNRRRLLLTEGLQAIEGITLVEPRGAFYAFLSSRNRLADRWTSVVRPWIRQALPSSPVWPSETTAAFVCPAVSRERSGWLVATEPTAGALRSFCSTFDV